MEVIPATAVWDDPPALDAAWERDAEVRQVVYFAVNPENRPERGKEAISEFAAAAGETKKEALIKVFSGLLAETNSLYGITVVGIRSFILRAKILNEEVAENDAKLAALSDADVEQRQGLQQARFWNFRNMDDAEEEAEFLCRRLNYLEEKLGLLTERVRAEMPSD